MLRWQTRKQKRQTNEAPAPGGTKTNELLAILQVDRETASNTQKSGYFPLLDEMSINDAVSR